MKVILHFTNLNDLNAKKNTFFLNLNEVSQTALDIAAKEYQEEMSGMPDGSYAPVNVHVEYVKWQSERIEFLGYAQASMMSARTRLPFVFSGYELPERALPRDEDGDHPYIVDLPVFSWKSLVADDYLKQ